MKGEKIMIIIKMAEGLDLSEAEEKLVQSKISYLKERYEKDDVEVYIDIIPGDDCIAVNYKAVYPKFERIRRITGYLVGTIDRWNNAKRSEERERLVHA